jgi:DNA-binding transcriptional LysR family regulator
MDLAGAYLDPGELAAFVAAVESGTVGGAAEVLELTQSAATKRLLGLERRLGVTLLERGRFGVRPTHAGRLLYPEAKQALAALARAAEAVGTHAAHAPSLRIAASHTIGEFLLPGWLASFRAQAPTPPRVAVEVVNSQTVLSRVREQQAEIGFIESLHALEGFDELTIARDKIVVVVGAGHRWAKRRSVPARALAEEPYLTREPGSGTRAVAAAALARAGARELEPSLEAASTQSLKRAVLAGGFTMISRLAVEAEVQAGTLCALPVSGANLSRPLRAVRRRQSPLRGEPRRFWSFLGRIASAGA